MLLTIDRLYAIRHPFKYRARNHDSYYNKLFPFVMLLSFTPAALMFYHSVDNTVEDDAKICPLGGDGM